MLVIVLLINKNAKLYYCKYLLMIPRNSVNCRQGEFEPYCFYSSFFPGWNERLDRHNKVRPAWFTHRLYLRSGWVEKRWLSQGNFCNTRNYNFRFSLLKDATGKKVLSLTTKLSDYFPENLTVVKSAVFGEEFFPDVYRCFWLGT